MIIKKFLVCFIIISFLSAQTSEAALRSIGRLVPRLRSARSHLVGSTGSVRTWVSSGGTREVPANQVNRNFNRFLLGAGAGVVLGGAAVNAHQWRMEHPEEWRSMFPPVPVVNFDPDFCRDQENRPFLDLKKKILEGGLLEALKRAFFHSKKEEKFDCEVPDFFRQKELNDLTYEELKVWFNTAIEEEAVGENENDSSALVAQPQGPFKTRLEKTMESTGLTEQEVLSIYMYSLSSDGVNAGLRKEGDHPAPLINQLIQSGLEKLAKAQPHSSDAPLYRGTALPKSVFNQMRAQGVFSDPGYLSTSANAEVSAGFIKEGIPETERVLFVIEGAQSGAKIDVISSYEDQGEVLFPAGTPFRVKSMRQNTAHGRWEVHLEEQKE